ncbi:hypothetical protein [Bacillus sp. EB600]|uniref:hypothetical protein n=1 Tax=Bacillus sp. EB600 TaxID=2806345 RepID=UPI0035BFBE7D
MKFWKPKNTFEFSAEAEVAATVTVQEKSTHQVHYTGGQIFKAWSPFLILTGAISNT